MKNRSPLITTASLILSLLIPTFSLMAQGADNTIEKRTQVHRLDSKQRAPFDAFVYVNRIPERANKEESPTDFAGRIYGRLANQEGRILLKLPPGMDRKAYLGYKTFLGSEGDEQISNCVSCHAPGQFTDIKSHVTTKGAQAKPTPSLRNLKTRQVDLENVIRAKLKASEQKRSGTADEIDDAYKTMAVTEQDIPNLVAFLTRSTMYLTNSSGT